MSEMDVRNIWHGVGAMFALAVLAAGTALFMAPKKVDGYYLSHGSSSGNVPSTCVYAHWTWHVDEVAFCSDKYESALDFMAKANASLGK